MIGENRQYVTDEPVEFEKSRLKFKTAGKLPTILEESIGWDETKLHSFLGGKV